MKRYETTFDARVLVEIDETKFTEEFMAEFRKSFFDFYTIEEHVEHLSQMYLRGVADDYDFIEGYGDPKEFGIKFIDYKLYHDDTTESSLDRV